MINLIISIVVFCKAVVRKRYSFIPASLIIALYELVCLFEVRLMDYAGLLERVLATGLLAAVLFVCLKKQLHICAVLPASVVTLVRWVWTRGGERFQQLMQDPGSDAAALLQRASMVRSALGGFLAVMILWLQILMLWELRKN